MDIKDDIKSFVEKEARLYIREMVREEAERVVEDILTQLGGKTRNFAVVKGHNDKLIIILDDGQCYSRDKHGSWQVEMNGPPFGMMS